MPVLDIQKELRGSWPCLGRIRLGAPKPKNVKRPGQDLPYFDLRDVPELVAVLGENPTEIPVYLPFDDMDRVLIAFHENYIAGGLTCMGDGERILYRRNGEMEAVIRQGAVVIPFGDYTVGEVVPCPGLAHSHPWCQGCKPRMRLRVMVAGVYRLGYYEVVSSSIINLRTITERLLALQDTVGRLTRIPLWLVRKPTTISVPSGDGKRIQITKHLLDLVVDVAAAKQQVAAFLPHEALALAAPEEEEEDVASAEELEQVVEGKLLKHEKSTSGDSDEPSDLEIVEEMEAGWADGAEEQPEGPPVPPADLEALAKARAYFARADDNENATPKQAQYLASLLEEALGGGEVATAERHAWLEAVCGVTSCKDLGKRQANRMIDFLTQGNGRLDPLAAKRVRAVMRAVRMEQGQQQLPLQSPEDIEIVREAAEEQGQREMPVDDPRPADVRAAAQVL